MQGNSDAEADLQRQSAMREISGNLHNKSVRGNRATNEMANSLLH